MIRKASRSVSVVSPSNLIDSDLLNVARHCERDQAQIDSKSARCSDKSAFVSTVFVLNCHFANSSATSYEHRTIKNPTKPKS